MRGLVILHTVVCLVVGGKDLLGVPAEFFRDYFTTLGANDIMFVVPDDIIGKNNLPFKSPFYGLILHLLLLLFM